MIFLGENNHVIFWKNNHMIFFLGGGGRGENNHDVIFFWGKIVIIWFNKIMVFKSQNILTISFQFYFPVHTAYLQLY